MSKPMKAGTLPKILKWVGYGTAILSLVAGLGKITKVISDRVEARRNIRALLSSEEVQRQGGDYGSAWRSLEQASQIDPHSAEVLDARENLAMEWLENIRVLEGEKFSDRKSTRLNSSHVAISYAVFCLKKKKKNRKQIDVNRTSQ